MSFRRYLIWFANEHLDFRLNEIKSIASLLNINVKWIDVPEQDPYWVVGLESDEEAKKIASRSVTMRSILELWAMSDKLSDFHNSLRSNADILCDRWSSPDVSFKIKVETFCNSQTHQEKVEKIESFSYLPLRGPVKLKGPDVAFQFIEYFGLDPDRKATSPRKDPLKLFFGRVVADGQRDLITKLSLKKRKFIGNTSMDPQLSLIMANQAQVREGDLVFDPFVGTGSLLVAAAVFGGYIMGADIDYLMLHGRTRPTRKQHRDRPRDNESILNNMIQYELADKYIDMVVADTSIPLWTNNFLVDAIITDPPYGVREATERIGTNKKNCVIREEHINTHIPSKVDYSIQDLLRDLLDFAARHLSLNRRLVTWIPIVRSEYKESDLPSHECLELVGNSEQILSTTSSRRLLTYVKTKHLKTQTSTSPHFS